LFQVDIIFPSRYPFTPAFFDIQKTWMLSMMNRTLLSKKLTQIAINHAKRGRPCLETAIKYLLGGNANIEGMHSVSTTQEQNSVSSNHSLHTDITNKASITSIGNQNSEESATSTTTDEEDYLTMGAGHLKPFSKEKDSHNVPFPRLCGASFAQNGNLVYFISPLPHPSSTKFTAYTLTTRNQQPILQSQSFTTQPKTYALYENYRSFVLARCPRMFIGGVPALQDRGTVPDDSQLKDRKLDYWLDDEEMDDDVPNMYWRPKTNTYMQLENQETFDFLAKLNSFNLKTQSSKDIRRSSITSITKCNSPTKLPNILINPGSSIPSGVPFSPVTLSVHPRRKSIGVMQYDEWSRDVSDLGIPFQEPTLQVVDSQPLEMDMLGMIRKAKLKRPSDRLVPIQTTVTPHIEPEDDVDDSKYGTTVHVVDLEFLLPVSKKLAHLYKSLILI
jgi:hypothetical protein